MDSRRAVVLTNMHTRNLGNLALSGMILELVRRSYGAETVVPLHRFPHPLPELIVGRVSPQRWPRAVELLAGKPAAVARADSHARPVVAPALKESAAAPRALRAARAVAHTLPFVAARALASRRKSNAFLSQIHTADDVIWNPAGEINAYATPSERLLAIELSLALGKRVGVVNFSFEPTTEVEAFFRRRAKDFTSIRVRDEPSRERLVGLGVPEAAIDVIPDAVFTISPANTWSTERPDTVGVVLHGLTDAAADRWAAVIRALVARGFKPEIVSSHHVVDAPLIDRVRQLAGTTVSVAPEVTDIGTYMEMLAGLRAVISARFHTAVLGLVNGTQVFGVDTYGRKVRDGLAAAGFGDCVIHETDWAEHVLGALETSPVDPRPRVRAVAEQVRQGYSRTFPL